LLIGRRKPLTAAQQFLNLQVSPISPGDGELRAGRLTWWYVATPSPLSRDYSVRIEFAQGGVPETYVDAPDLQALAGDRKIPHLYSRRPPRLCLYLPKTYEWQSWMRLDQTVVPWSVLWLFYFEDWLLYDDWKGGGMHPSEGDAHRREAA
jgi:hypothetical protein